MPTPNRDVSANAAAVKRARAAIGEHTVAFLSSGLLRRAAELDTSFAELDLGLADTAVMACAERHDLPILTFDFAHFRATRPRSGYWRLVVDEAHYAEATRKCVIQTSAPLNQQHPDRLMRPSPDAVQPRPRFRTGD